jgi:hypothetical protein
MEQTYLRVVTSQSPVDKKVQWFSSRVLHVLKFKCSLNIVFKE